jgi:hypothetical protein
VSSVQIPRKTSGRGYGSRHQRLRRAFVPFVAAGLATCARCGGPIRPSQSWDLGHDNLDRAKYNGPEHRYAADCPAGGNRATNWGRLQSREW